MIGFRMFACAVVVLLAATVSASGTDCDHGTKLPGNGECLCTREGHDSCVGSRCEHGHGISFYKFSCTDCHCLPVAARSGKSSLQADTPAKSSAAASDAPPPNRAKEEALKNAKAGFGRAAHQPPTTRKKAGGGENEMEDGFDFEEWSRRMNQVTDDSSYMDHKTRQQLIVGAVSLSFALFFFGLFVCGRGGDDAAEAGKKPAAAGKKPATAEKPAEKEAEKKAD